MRSARLGWTPIAVAALLAGCALPEARVRGGLERAGLSPTLSACMAERMVDRLSLAQLRRLGSLPQARDARSLPTFLREVRAPGDPEIVGVVSSSAALCATGLATQAVLRPFCISINSVQGWISGLRCAKGWRYFPFLEASEAGTFP